jgi:hypothetical protein
LAGPAVRIRFPPASRQSELDPAPDLLGDLALEQMRIREAEASAGGGDPWRNLCRRLVGHQAQIDLPGLEQLAAAGATDCG